MRDPNPPQSLLLSTHFPRSLSRAPKNSSWSSWLYPAGTGGVAFCSFSFSACCSALRLCGNCHLETATMSLLFVSICKLTLVFFTAGYLFKPISQVLRGHSSVQREHYPPRFIVHCLENPQAGERARLQPALVNLTLICMHDVCRNISVEVPDNGIIFERGEVDGSEGGAIRKSGSMY